MFEVDYHETGQQASLQKLTELQYHCYKLPAVSKSYSNLTFKSQEYILGIYIAREAPCAKAIKQKKKEPKTTSAEMLT